jgi:MoxR-like ATPase
MDLTDDQSTRQHGTFRPDGGDVPAAVLGAGGALVFLLGSARRSTPLRVVGALAALGACAFYARRKYEVRRARIDVAESHIRSELDDLDPVARAQVLADIARSGLGRSS